MNKTVKLLLVLMVLAIAGTVAYKVLSTSASTPAKSDPAPAKEAVDLGKYKTVRIGSETWMVENLNEPVEGSFCYDNDPKNCERYGRLYTFGAAKKLCSGEWRLPGPNDVWRVLQEMKEMDGMEEIDNQGAARALASRDWRLDDGVLGKDVMGLAILPSGERIPSEFVFDGSGKELYQGMGSDAKIWIDANQSATSRILYVNAQYYDYEAGADTSVALAVRCVKD